MSGLLYGDFSSVISHKISSLSLLLKNLLIVVLVFEGVLYRVQMSSFLNFQSAKDNQLPSYFMLLNSFDSFVAVINLLTWALLAWLTILMSWKDHVSQLPQFEMKGQTVWVHPLHIPWNVSACMIADTSNHSNTASSLVSWSRKCNLSV